MVASDRLCIGGYNRIDAIGYYFKVINNNDCLTAIVSIVGIAVDTGAYARAGQTESVCPRVVSCLTETPDWGSPAHPFTKLLVQAFPGTLRTRHCDGGEGQAVNASEITPASAFSPHPSGGATALSRGSPPFEPPLDPAPFFHATSWLCTSP